MHSKSELSFQHGQRLASAHGMELLRITLKYNSRIDVPRQAHQSDHGVIVEKRRFVNVNVGSSQRFPEPRDKTRLVQEPRNGIRLTKRLLYIRPSRLLGFDPQRNPALFTIGRNQHHRPTGIKRCTDESLHEIRLTDAGATADIQELILAR